MPEEKKKKKKTKKEEKKEPTPPPEPEPAPPTKGPFDDEPVEWGVEEETPAEAPAEGEAPPPAEGEEAPAETAAPAEGEEAPANFEQTAPQPEEEPIFQKKIQIGAHWRKPYMRLYGYNWDVEEFYYKPLVDFLGERKANHEQGPGAQTYAERCVKYWPGMCRKEQMLFELEQEKSMKTMAKKKQETLKQAAADAILDEPPKWKDPLEPRVLPHTVAFKTSYLSTHLSKSAVHKRTSHLTDQVMDIFGLHVPEATAHDADLALYLRRLRKPVEPDIKQIELDLDRHKRIRDQIIGEEKAKAPSPVGRRHNPDYTPPKSRPVSLISPKAEYLDQLPGQIESKARLLQRRKNAWKY